MTFFLLSLLLFTHTLGYRPRPMVLRHTCVVFSSSSSSGSTAVDTNKPKPNQIDFNQIIDACKKTGVYTPAVRAAAGYMNSDFITAPGLTGVIKIYGLAGLIDDAIDALKKAKQKGLMLNIRHYNAVLTVCRKHKRYDDASELYETLVNTLTTMSPRERASLTPDLVTYSNIIGVYGDLNEWKSALEVFYQVEVTQRDLILYSAILSTLERNNRVTESEQIFAEIKRQPKVSVTVPIYTSIISVLGKSGDWERAYQIFLEMSEKDGEKLIPDRVLVYTMIRILEKAKQLDKAALVKQNSMRQLGNLSNTIATDASASINPIISSSITSNNHNDNTPTSTNTNTNSITNYNDATPFFNDLIREGKRCGDFRVAETAADAWLQDEKSILSSGAITACVSIYGQARKPQKALDILTIARQRGYPITCIVMNSIMSTCVKYNRPDDALALFAQMKDVDEFSSLPSTSSSSSTSSELPLVRDIYSYGTALNALAKQGNWKDTLALFRKIEYFSIKDYLKPNIIMYNTVLSALGKAKEYSLLGEIYTAMFQTQSSVHPDKVTHFTVLAALDACGKTKAAARLRGVLRSQQIVLTKDLVESILKEETYVPMPSSSSSSSSSASKAVSSDEPSLLEKTTKTMTKDDSNNHHKSDIKETNNNSNNDNSNDDSVEDDEDTTILESIDDLPYHSTTEITLSPAGTLREKLLHAGRRSREKKTGGGMVGGGTSSSNTLEMEGSGGGGGGGGKYKWEKGGGGAASLMKLLGAAGQIEDVEAILHELEAQNDQAPLPTSLYNAAISAYGAKEWRRALSLYSSMGGKIARDMQTYKEIVPVLETAGLTDPEAHKALQLVIARGHLEGLR